MQIWKVEPGRRDMQQLVARVEAVALELGLTCTMRGTLKAHPGCEHWHFKQDDEKGVVEVTLSPTRGGSLEAWVSVQAGRSTAGMLALAEKLAEKLSDR
jgi:hypothetical protein